MHPLLSNCATLLVPLIPAVACAQPQFSELFINPPGPDQGYESIEIMGEPGYSMAECWIIVIDGNRPNPGVVLQLIDLSGATIGSNGLLLVRDDLSIAILPPPDPATVLVLHDFDPDLINSTLTFVLAAGTPWFARSFDLDFDNNGVLDSPLFMTVHDAVSYSDGGANDYEYAGQLDNGVELGTHSGAGRAYTPDAIYRILDAAGSSLTWAGGDVVGPLGGPWTWNNDKSFGFEAACLTSVATIELDLGSENFRFLPYADCDSSTGPGVLDIFDFLCFIDAFVRGLSYACDCDTSTGPEGCDIFDFLCFQQAFTTGCR